MISFMIWSVCPTVSSRLLTRPVSASFIFSMMFSASLLVKRSRWARSLSSQPSTKFELPAAFSACLISTIFTAFLRIRWRARRGTCAKARSDTSTDSTGRASIESIVNNKQRLRAIFFLSVHIHNICTRLTPAYIEL